MRTGLEDTHKLGGLGLCFVSVGCLLMLVIF
jgi:hypothetical protein